MVNLNTVKMKNITTKIGSGITPRGGNSVYLNSGIPLVRSQNVLDNQFSYNGLVYINDDIASTMSNVELKKDDVLLNITGDSVARCAQVPIDIVGGRVNQHVAIIRANKNMVDPYYLKLHFINNRVKELMLSLADCGGTRKALTKSMIEDMEIDLPPLPVQRRIAAILSSLDDKIENNRKTCEKLEEIAQAIFKRWFVDFEFPTDKGLPYKSSCGEMEYCEELGKEMPKGWKFTKLENVISTIESGNRPQGGVGDLNEGIPSIGAENIIGLGKYDYSKEKYVTEDYFNRMSKGIVHSGDVLLYKDGAQIGRKAMFMNGFPHVKCCVNSHVFILRTNNTCTQEYLYFWLDQPSMTQNIIKLNANSAQPGINQSQVKKLHILLPQENVLTRYTNIAEVLMTMLFKVCVENNVLVNLRDVLLPKLMSGEIAVDEEEVE